MYNFNNYQPTFNKAIDHCANIIGCARANNMPIKALHLQTNFYEWFKSGVKQIMANQGVPESEIAEVDNEESMLFDGVDISKGSRFQTKPIIIEHYQSLN